MSGSHIKSQGIRNIFICLNSDSLSHRSFSSIHSCKINRKRCLALQYIMLRTLIFLFLLSKHIELRTIRHIFFSGCCLFSLFVFCLFIWIDLLCFTRRRIQHTTLEGRHSSTSDLFFLCRFIGPYRMCLCCTIPQTAMYPSRMFYFKSTQN